MIFVLVVLFALSLYFGLTTEDILDVDVLDKSNANPDTNEAKINLRRTEVDTADGAQNTLFNRTVQDHNIHEILTGYNFGKNISNTTSQEGVTDLQEGVPYNHSKEILSEGGTDVRNTTHETLNRVEKDFQNTTHEIVTKVKNDFQNTNSNIKSKEYESVYSMKGIKVTATDYDLYADDK